MVMKGVSRRAGHRSASTLLRTFHIASAPSLNLSPRCRGRGRQHNVLTRANGQVVLMPNKAESDLCSNCAYFISVRVEGHMY